MMRRAEMRPGRAAPPRVSESIESRENRWLKRFRVGLSGEIFPHRFEFEETAGVEGARLVETALRSGVEVLAVLFSETGAQHISRLQTNATSCTASFTQIAGVEALRGPQESVEEMNAEFIRGCSFAALTMAQAMTWVKEAFDCPVSVRWLLTTRRFSSSDLTGMVRMEVAVGTASDASMF